MIKDNKCDNCGIIIENGEKVVAIIPEVEVTNRRLKKSNEIRLKLSYKSLKTRSIKIYCKECLKLSDFYHDVENKEKVRIFHCSMYDKDHEPFLPLNKEIEIRHDYHDDGDAEYGVVLLKDKEIIGCSLGMSLIKDDDNIAGAVFFFAGSKTILYFLILFFLR